MSSYSSSALLAFLHEGIKRVISLLKKGNQDQAYVLLDLLASSPTSSNSVLKYLLNEFLELYPDEKKWIEPIRNRL